MPSSSSTKSTHPKRQFIQTNVLSKDYETCNSCVITSKRPPFNGRDPKRQSHCTEESVLHRRHSILHIHLKGDLTPFVVEDISLAHTLQRRTKI
ncbi:hypothetical protein TNCT_419091, partial [Trichonephila clavata]